MEFKNLAIQTICISCNQLFKKDIEDMLKTCSECAEVIKKHFDRDNGWTKENLKMVCNEIIAKKIKELPDEGMFRKCRFCGRITDMVHGIMVSPPDFCHRCWDSLGANLNADGYLCLLSK
ncbi:hypothetical protein IBX65_07365 [Candidatus Aerophobetes bacterium]|nr:hypothetical protein [Candidatus Aerophobetes bacterium]